MATRIRYKKNPWGVYESQEFSVLDQKYQATYQLSDRIFGVVSNVTTEPYTSVHVRTTKRLSQLKKELKRLLINLGVKFTPEVRRKKEHKQAIKRALDAHTKI